MGGSRWSDDSYQDRAAIRNARVGVHGQSAAFSYTHAVQTGAAPQAVNPLLDPKRAAGATSPFAGRVMRESRDSADHPESLAIAVFFDVTGSMGSIPVTLEKKLAGLMALLLRKGYVDHPQILFGAVGDAHTDKSPLQVGQFESGVEMDDDLDKFYLEGNGGGQMHETYELSHYFMWKHSSIDCWEKRQHKGYFFSMGDEAPYDVVRKAHVQTFIGDALERDIPTAEVIRGLEERYHVFHIKIEEGSYRHNADIEQAWVRLLGERFLKLEDQNNVAELIASTIGLTEGTTDIDRVPDDLAVMGASAAVGRSVTQALTVYAQSSHLRAGAVSGPLPAAAPAGGVTRL